MGIEKRSVSFYHENGNIRAATLGTPTCDTLELHLGAEFGSLSALSQLEIFGLGRDSQDW